MTTAVLAPWAKGEVARLGQRVFRKEILRFGHVQTDDGDFDFTPEFGQQIVDAFQAGVMPTVPLVLADADNRHTQAVDRQAGEVVGLELSATGLTGIIRANAKTTEMIEENRRLPVSIRALQGRLDNNGKRWPAVLNHVLATFDPVVTGMGDWEPIELSNDVTKVIDLANPAGHKKEDAVTDTKIGALSADEAEKLHELLGKMLGKDSAKSEDPEDKPDGGTVEDPEKGGDAPGTEDDPSGSGNGEDDNTEVDVSQLTDEQLEKLLLELNEQTDAGTINPQAPKGTIDVGAKTGEDTESDSEKDKEKEKEPIAASNSSEKSVVELANARFQEQATELARVQERLDASEFDKERDELVKKTGLPPRIINLARPLLEGTGRVVQLSHGKTVDAGAVARELFGEIGKTLKALDLSHPSGFAIADEDTEESDQEEKDRAEFIERAKKQFRLG